MNLRKTLGVGLLVTLCLGIGYAAGKIKSGQEAKERLVDAMVVMAKGESMSDKQLLKICGDLQEVSAYLWARILADPDKMKEQDLAVLCANEALQVALTAGMVSETDLFKNAAKQAGKDAPNLQKTPESMGEIAGFLLAVADPQLWTRKMGNTN